VIFEDVRGLRARAAAERVTRLRDVLADRRLVWCLAGTTLA
jgi:hypothetical protein